MFKPPILLTAFILLALAFSCTEEPPSAPGRTNPLDEQNPQTHGDPFHLTAEIYGGGVRLRWQTVNVASVVGYNIYRKLDDGAFTLYQEVEGRESASYIDADVFNGHKYTYYLVARNSQGQESTSNTAQVIINNTPVCSIDDQNGYTPTRRVNLTLLAFGAVSMQIGTPDLANAQWVNYATAFSLQLPTGEGSKITQARFAYPAGDTSAVMSDTTQPMPMNPIFNIAHNSLYSAARQVWLFPTAVGTNLKCKFSENNQFTGASWVNTADSVSFTLSPGAGTKTVYAKFKNDFEIESNTLSDQISPHPMNPAVNIQPDSAYINHSNVNLSLPNVGALQMKLNTFLDSASVAWQNYVSQFDNFNLGSGDGLRRIYAWFRNDWFIAGPAQDSVWLDTHCAVDSFYWTSTARDTLFPGDTLEMSLWMADDLLGKETGGRARVSLGNVFSNLPLPEQGNGLYRAFYTVQPGPGIAQGVISADFTDRAGNAIPPYPASQTINIFSNLNPTEVGYCNTYGDACCVAVLGNYAYVADYDDGLRVIDISNPSSPYEVGFWDTPGWARGVAVAGNYAYVADGWDGLHVINIGNPANPYRVGHCDTPDYSYSVAVSGNYAYMADDEAGLRIINISNPANPLEAGYYSPPGYALDVAVSGNYAFVAYGYSGLRIVNIYNPANPFEAGYYDTPGNAIGVAIFGNYAYVADGTSLRIININNPVNPYEIGFYNISLSVGVAISGNYAYVADGSGLRIINIGNPANPLEVGFCISPGYSYYVAVSGNYAFVADGGAGLRVIRIWGP